MNQVNLGSVLFPEPEVIPRNDHWQAAAVILAQYRDKGEPGLVFTRGLWWKAGEDGVWYQCSDDTIRKEVIHLKDIARWYGQPGEPSKRIQLTASYIKAVYDTMRIIAAEEGFFDNPTPGIAFQNGFLDVDTMEFRAIKRSDLVTSVLPWEWDPEASYQPWLKFLGEVFGPDSAENAAEKIQYLREWLGVVLARRSTQHRKVTLLKGKGRNGKSILADTITGIFPSENVASLSPQYFSQTEKVGVLSTSYINVVADISNRAIKDAGNFKAIVSGDVVMGRRLYRDPFTFRAECGHLFSCNELPSSYDTTEGFFSRIVVLEFNATFGGGKGEAAARPKELIESELRACTPGIIRWAVEGIMAVKKRGRLFTPESSEKVLQRWKESLDPIERFVRDRLDTEAYVEKWEDGIPDAAMYEAFRKFCEEWGDPCLTRASFTSKLTELGVQRSKRIMIRGERMKYWRAKWI